MQIELRPLSFGEVLDRTIQIYRSRFPMFTGIMSVGAGLLLLLQGAQLFLTRTGRTSHHPPAALVMIVGGLLLICLSFVFIVGYIVVLAALFRAVGDMYTGVPTGVGRAYSAVWRRWFRYLRLYLSIALIATAPVVVPAMAMALGVIAVASAHIRSSAGTGTLVALFTIAGLLLAVGLAFTVWLSFRYILAGSACVFENVGVAQSLRRSGILSKGQRWRIFVLSLLTVTIQWCIMALFIVPVFPMIMLHRGSAPIVVSIAVLFGTFVSRILAEPILWIGLMVCYFDARIRREGFDVEWQLQRSAEAEAIPSGIPSALPQSEIPGLEPA